MSTNSDFIFYITYALIFIFAGVFGILWGLEYIDGIEAFLFWLLTLGLLLFIIGLFKAIKRTDDSSFFLLIGLILAILSSVTLALIWNVFNLLIAFSVTIILIGMIILVFNLFKRRNIIE